MSAAENELAELLKGVTVECIHIQGRHEHCTLDPRNDALWAAILRCTPEERGRALAKRAHP
jgi:hypothetical protein